MAHHGRHRHAPPRPEERIFFRHTRDRIDRVAAVVWISFEVLRFVEEELRRAYLARHAEQSWRQRQRLRAPNRYEA